MKEILKTLVITPAVSGYEKQLGMSENILSFFSGFNSWVDAFGNVIVKIASGKKTILIDAHMDEVGFLKTNNGFVKVGDIGVFDENDLDATSLFRVACFRRNFVCEDSLIKSPALDNKVGCTVLVSLAEQLKTLDANIFLSFSVQEELDGKGIKEVLKKVKPDLFICVDSAYAQPYEKKGWEVPVLGQGCAVQIQGKGFKSNLSLLKGLDMKYQFEIVDSNSGATNLSSVEVLCSCVQINIPVRNQHEKMSEVDLRDMESAKELITRVTKNYLNMQDNGGIKDENIKC